MSHFIKVCGITNTTDLSFISKTNIDAVGLITARSGINIGHPSVASTMTSGGDLILGKDLSVSGVSTFTGVVELSAK